MKRATPDSSIGPSLPATFIIGKPQMLERERIQLEARKLVPGEDGGPTVNPDLINAAFPLTRPDWDYSAAEGRGRLLIYHQTLMAGLRAAARKPTNLAKVYSIIQGKTESPATFLGRLMEAFRQYTPMDPEAPENQATVVMSFVNQAASDIKKKLQKLEDLEGKQIQDLLCIAQWVYNNRDAPEDKQLKATREMTKVLAAIVQKDQGPTGEQKTRPPQAPPRQRPMRLLNNCARDQSRGKPKWPPSYLGKGWGSDPLPEPRVILQVEGTPVQFLVDTGAQHSVLTSRHGKICHKSSWVQGATGTKKYPWTTQRTVDLGSGRVTHSFLVISDSPCPLLGRDLLKKMGAQIHFQPGGPKVTDSQDQPISVLTIQLENEYRLHQTPPLPEQDIGYWLHWCPEAWAETGGIGLAKHRPALFIEVKPGADPVRVKQYPMSAEARLGITPHIRRLLDVGILRPCHSAWNTPLLPVRKPNSGDYRPVQDLREVNKRVMDIHPTVPNPYTLLSTLSPDKQWYTALDLKDAFFTLPLAPKSQDIFAFEWADPERGINGQLTWTRLPQGFKNSPTLFDEALHEDLSKYQKLNPNVFLLQYVDDLLIAAETREACLLGTKNLLQTLGDLGYRASAKKAQICKPEVIYLGYLLKKGQRWLTDARKETVLRIPQPTTPRQVREFLGSVGFCRLWIPGFAEMAKPFYAVSKNQPSFEWSAEAEQAFQQIKRALLSAPALGLPDISKPFHLSVDEHKGIAKAVGADWKLHCAYRPQSSGQVERMNRTLKETLTKLTMETGLKDSSEQGAFVYHNLMDSGYCFLVGKGQE
ncbi:LOW QUALITY PROTEIN: uncharacterized protein LOC121028038 [Herpailurus yagouaroundi]|uniref:LOW QUALITY PROTEIN: uncharacterized protein LOC121028038 n=1 Tax=Herpailurus yagouaroundi TaxID=1608482 RepID=UPI001AD7CCE8|nr:LOW QUALITY PROTEIN: uncharacterized protein LOC121028038 [Puma yagouaroundi]